MKIILHVAEKWFLKNMFAFASTLVEISWLIAASYIVEAIREWWALPNIWVVFVSTVGVLFMSTSFCSMFFFFCNNEIGYFAPQSFWCRTIIRLLLLLYFIYDFSFQIYHVPIIVQALFYVIPYIIGAIILLSKKKKNRVSRHILQKCEAVSGSGILFLLFVACFLLIGPLIEILPADLWQFGCFSSATLAFLSMLLLLKFNRKISRSI